MIWWIWVPFLMVTYIVTDTFAGERERHTLETLLASRLTDRAILFGKIVSVVVYGWAVALIGITVSVITVNIAAGKGRLLMYSPEAALAILALTFLSSLLSSTIGVFISMRSTSVRQAQQVTGLIGLIPILPMVLLDVLPGETVMRFLTTMSQVNGIVVVLGAVGFFAAIDLALVALAVKRFQRARLILD
jgi:ABC-2 type transport system permease protein